MLFIEKAFFLSFIPAIAYSHLPASGYRSNTTGALGNVGTYGYAWSSSPSAAGNANGGFMNFNATEVNPLNGGNRAIARPVRCVQHLRLLFYKE